MHISLPPGLKEFVDARIASGGFSSVSDYMRSLIRDDQKALERAQREEHASIEKKLLEALESPEREMTADDWLALRQALIKRHGGLGAS